MDWIRRECRGRERRAAGSSKSLSLSVGDSVELVLQGHIAQHGIKDKAYTTKKKTERLEKIWS